VLFHNPNNLSMIFSGQQTKRVFLILT
jgi:hypothetical protein